MVVLDTDVLINLSKGNKHVVDKVRELEETEGLAITVLNLEEYLYGIHKRQNEDEITLGNEFMSKFTVYEYEKKCASIIAKIKLSLEKTGSRIGDYDECIAGICMANNESLFTLNRKHFERIKELQLV